MTSVPVLLSKKEASMGCKCHWLEKTNDAGEKTSNVHKYLLIDRLTARIIGTTFSPCLPRGND